MKNKSKRCSTGHGTGHLMPADLHTMLDRGRLPLLRAGARRSEHDRPEKRCRRRRDSQAAGKKLNTKARREAFRAERVASAARAFVSWVRQKWRKKREAVSATAALIALLLASSALAQDAPTIPSPVSVPSCAVTADVMRPLPPSPVSGPARQEMPKSEVYEASVNVIAGAVSLLGGGAESTVQPFGTVMVDWPFRASKHAPHLLATADVLPLPGQALNWSDPATFRGVQFTVAAYQRIADLNAALHGAIGLATRLPGKLEPFETAAYWWTLGIRFAGPKGFLELGGGMDERLGGGYAPTAHVRGGVLIAERKGKLLKGAKSYLVGQAILPVRLWYWTNPRTAVVLLGVGVGR